MAQLPKGLKKHLPAAIITTLTIFALSFLLNPISKILDALLSRFSSNSIELSILRLLVGLLIVLLGLVSYVVILHRRLNTKRLFKFGVYWHKVKPYCPACGNKLEDTAFDFIVCANCSEQIKLYDIKTNTYPNLKEAIEIIRKET
ncbi:MAG: hypothetical protein MUP85_18760 [Candidatus Lokiarchaeota archaeon]|nr:hypothetical protein [Candidatus Lokiarchaeota archaeon]